MDLKKIDRGFSVQWHITYRCDQRCKHCYIFSGSDKEIGTDTLELNVNQCKNVIDKFLYFCREMGCFPMISLTGGDPLLYPGIWKVLEYMKQNNIPFQILGNPFHLDESVARNLKDLGCRNYQLSLDGMEITHDFLRKPGSFRATLKSFEVLKVAKIRTVVMNTVSRINYRELTKLIGLVVASGVDGFSFARYCPTHNDIDSILSPFEYKNLLKDAWDVYTELSDKGTKFYLKDNLWNLFLFERGLLKIQETGVVVGGCNCGVTNLTILPDGTVYYCRRFDSPIGNVSVRSLKDIFLSDSANNYRDISRLEGCKNCELLYYCRGCHAVSYGTYGDYFAKDPQCWRWL